MLATEETPLTADLPGASRKSNSSRDAGGSMVVSNRRDAINSKLIPGASRKVTIAGMLEAAWLLATEETPLTANLYQEHHGK